MYHAACKLSFNHSNGRTHSWRFSTFYIYNHSNDRTRSWRFLKTTPGNSRYLVLPRSINQRHQYINGPTLIIWYSYLELHLTYQVHTSINTNCCRRPCVHIILLICDNGTCSYEYTWYVKSMVCWCHIEYLLVHQVNENKSRCHDNATPPVYSCIRRFELFYGNDEPPERSGKLH